MLTRVRTWAPVLGLAVAWAAAAEARPTRSGKVVRIERSRLVSNKRLQICQINPAGPAGNQSFCVGPKPDSGAEGVWFDMQSTEVIGRVRIDNARPSSMDTCGLGTWHTVDADITETGPGRVQPQQYSPNLAILNLDAESDATMRSDHMPAPSGNPDEYVILVFDLDGDSDDDMVITQRACEQEYPPPPSVAGRVYSTQCYAFWVLDGTEWKHVREDVLHQCQ